LNAVPTHALDADAQADALARRLAEELAPALAQGLDLPLCALRASVESLRENLASDAAGRQVAANVLREVDHLGRNVRDLMDYATPPRPRPSRCTASEIAHSALGALPEGARARVTVARERTDAILFVDGPLVVRSLLRLLERAVEREGEVLLFARSEGGRALFGVVAGSALSSAGPRRQTDLSLCVVRRDLGLLAGSLELRTSSHGGTCATVMLPVEPSSAVAA
jgi:K+-sensing histidine kinase KdpD